MSDSRETCEARSARLGMKAMQHLTQMSIDLAKLFGPLQATRFLFGAGLGLMLEAHGKDAALNFLEDLRKELEKDARSAAECAKH